MLKNLNVAMCRGLYGHAWSPKPTAHGVAVKDDLLYLTSDCARCQASRYERIKLSTGEVVYRTYRHTVAFQLELAPGEPTPSKQTLRAAAAGMLVSSRRKRTVATKGRRATA